MGLRPEFENVRSSIQHRVPPPDIERAVADVRSEETRLALQTGGRSSITQGASDQVLAAEHASGHRPYGQNLQSGSSAGASGQRDMSKIICHYCKKPGHMIADSRKRQNANSHRQSDTAHLAAPPETPTESETSLSLPASAAMVTPTPDTDSFTPRQRKQIQRLNQSCHISSSSATGICSPLLNQHRGLLWRRSSSVLSPPRSSNTARRGCTPTCCIKMSSSYPFTYHEESVFSS